MASYTLGKKGEQKQWFDEKNIRRNMTEVSVADCFITRIRQNAVDGYFAINLASYSKS